LEGHDGEVRGIAWSADDSLLETLAEEAEFTEPAIFRHRLGLSKWTTVPKVGASAFLSPAPVVLAIGNTGFSKICLAESLTVFKRSSLRTTYLPTRACGGNLSGLQALRKPGISGRTPSGTLTARCLTLGARLWPYNRK